MDTCTASSTFTAVFVLSLPRAFSTAKMAIAEQGMAIATYIFWKWLSSKHSMPGSNSMSNFTQDMARATASSSAEVGFGLLHRSATRGQDVALALEAYSWYRGRTGVAGKQCSVRAATRFTLTL